MLRSPTNSPVQAGCLSLLSLVIGGAAHAPGERIYSIPPSIHASTALIEWAAQTHVALLFEFKTAHPQRSRAVVGVFEPAEALRLLLRDTTLTFAYVDPNTVAVFVAPQYCDRLQPLPPCGLQEPRI